MDSNVFQNEKLLKFWIWCLLKATHEEHETMVGFQKVRLKKGSFVFGRQVAAQELCMKESSVRNYLFSLRDLGNLDIKTTNKFSIVTVLNWSKYQDKGQQKDNKLTTSKQQVDTNKNGKNGKNINPLYPPKGEGVEKKIKLKFGKDFCHVLENGSIRIRGADGWKDWGGGATEDFVYGPLRGWDAVKQAKADAARTYALPSN